MHDNVGPKHKGPVEKDNWNFQIWSSGKLRERPQAKPKDKECLATWTKVGDLEVWTLWDSGSTTSGIIPSYAELAKIVVDTLMDPNVLQLGTVGSRSIIKFGADVSLRIAKHLYPSYVDVANFNHYDMIIGTPFMRKHGVLLDFKKNRVIINNTVLPAIRVELRDGDARLHRYQAMDKKKKQEWLEAAVSAIGRTTAATVAMSEPVKHTSKASIEGVEDEDDVRITNRKTLPASSWYTLMTESEYIEDMIRSEEGENATTKAKFATKTRENHRKTNLRWIVEEVWT